MAILSLGNNNSTFSGSFSGSFQGDGSSLTGVGGGDAFPFTGDAQITGSLVISASNNTSESLSIQGSGSTIFSIQGSQGQLFSVTDDLLDEVFSVADISGDTLLSVSGSGLVTIPVGDLSGSATATASYGAFKGDGSQLTNLPASSPFPLTGDAQITGSLIVSGSFNAFDRRDTTVTIGKGASDNNYQLGVAIGNGAEVTNNYAIAIGDGADSAAYSTTIGRASSTGQKSLTINTFGQNPATNTENSSFHWYTSNNTTPDLKFYYNNDSWWNSTGNFGFGHTAPLATVHISSSTSSSLIVEGSGSTLFEVIGSEGTIFSLEDDLDGTLFTVNDRTGIPMFEVSASGRIVAEEGESIIRSQRPMVTHTADFSITSSLDFAGKYHIVGGNLTCSINTSSIVPAGAEFEFFQTSSAGNFLYITASHVDLIVKNDNLNLAGRGSGATLKYIGGSTFHLVGDLT